MLMPTLFPGDLATREKPYDSLASMWTAFADLKHNTSPAIDGGAFASAPQASSLHAPPTVATPVTSVAASQRHNSPRGLRMMHHISHMHIPAGTPSRSITASGPSMTATTLLCVPLPITWSTPLLTENARRQACLQYSGRCRNCGSTEHSLRWCNAPFMNVFALINPEFTIHDADGSIFET